MSYTSESILPATIAPKHVIDVVELLGYEAIKGNLNVPNLIKQYYWYDRTDYKSWSGVELEVYNIKGSLKIQTRSSLSRSYWDLAHQNRTLKLLRDLFGGYFRTDAGKNRYWRPDEPPPSPLSSGCFLSRWRFENALFKILTYLESRKFAGNMARTQPTGLDYMDQLNPLLLSNNLIIPYVIAVWEEYYRSTFSVLLKYTDQKEAVLKKSNLKLSALEKRYQKKSL